MYVCICLQRNIDKIAGNLAELEAKLKHEQDKHAAFSEDLKAAEERCVPVSCPAHGCMHCAHPCPEQAGWDAGAHSATLAGHERVCCV